MKMIKTTLLSTTMLAFVGCSSTIHEQFSIDEQPAISLSLDAKQRLFLVTDKGGRNKNQRVVCAEPSPDALVGIAASGALEASMGSEGSGKLAASMAEAIGELGDRTPTIQLLRDGLYRACEAYMNGIYTNEEYREILYGYDDLVVTLLAIEGLTQRPRFPNIGMQAKTEAKATDNPEANTSPAVPPTEKQNNTVPSVSKEVAEAVRDILFDYYNLQRQQYGLPLVSSHKDTDTQKNNLSKTK
jgi:hypothetical protein